MTEEAVYEGTQFRKGNQFWKARATHGRGKIFSSPEVLWAACVEYFEWVEQNPLWEHKVFSFQGGITETSVPKMRAMTINGLCLFLDITDETWRNYGTKEEYSDFFGVVRQAEKTIYEQKFTGAAADMLNANIIARDLGLSDRQRLEHTGKNDGPIEVVHMKPEDIKRVMENDDC